MLAVDIDRFRERNQMTKRCLITGAGRGIGLEWARGLLGEGHTVIAATRTLTPELESLTRDFPGRAFALKADVSAKDVKACLDSFEPLIGPLDLLINNAGVFKTDQGFEQMDPASIEESFEVNTLGPVRVTQAVLAKLRQSSQPVVANVTSLMGSIADNKGGGYYSYRMSKAALNMFCKSFAVDHPDIISCVLHPGWVQTRMGGTGASLTTAQSVLGLMKVVTSLKKSDTGKFFNYDGRELPW